MSITYSTCRDCGELLHLTNHGDTVHPLCTPRPTQVERIALDYRAAIEGGDEFTADAYEYDIEIIDAQPPNMLEHALAYAAWGWPVFPLKTHQKVPATRNGFKDATTDPDRIRAWWTANPDNNIGLPTGHAFDVIDIDVPHGVAAYTDLVARDLLPDTHGRVTTSRGGLHLYVPASGDGNRAGIRPGIDYRGAGGYVVAPPSTLGVRGRAWTWSHPPSPLLTRLAVAEAVA